MESEQRTPDGAPLAPVTGNPVFDYRSGFRRIAGIVQRILIRLGALIAAVCGGAYLLGGAGPVSGTLVGWMFIAGVLAVAAGLAWGLLWRGRLRTDFREKHGIGVD